MGLIKERDQKRISPGDVSLSKDDLSRREMSLAKTSKVKFVWN